MLRRSTISALALLSACVSPPAGDIMVAHVDSGLDRFAARRQASQRFYAEHPDAYDLLVIWDGAEARSDSSLYLPVRNDVRGIGYQHLGAETFDRSADFGSARLDGIVWMGSAWRTAALDGDPHAILPVLAEETGHRFAATVHYRAAGGESDALLESDGLH